MTEPESVASPYFNVINRLAADVVAVTTIATVLAENYDYDQQTGLLRKEPWKQEIEGRIIDGQPFGVFFVDLDHFKDVNDTFGHEYGDVVIKEVASFLKTLFRRESDSLTHERFDQPWQQQLLAGRYGGDEFGIICDLSHGKTDPESLDYRWEQMSLLLRSNVARFVDNRHAELKSIKFGVSVGGARWKEGMGVGQLLEQADQAMYQGRSGRFDRLPEEQKQALLAARDGLRKVGLEGRDLSRYLG